MCSGDRSVSYAELGDRVNALARELISVGVGPDTAVGIRFERSVEMVVAVHAVWQPADSSCPSLPTRPPTGSVHPGHLRRVGAAHRECCRRGAASPAPTASGCSPADGVRVLAGSDGVRCSRVPTASG